ncbi:MAG TPA: nitrilase-related carbon-nitrogen hydrolase [Geminicoccaceae bacterium]|nr:nitrilase-related carbon-nitrogen hydrolase [Geminicoccaceae bacterium]
MKLAVACVSPMAADPAENLALLRALAFEAAGLGAALVLFPERFAMGRVTAEAAEAAAELSDGPTARALARIAAAARVGLLVGYVERCVTGLYNAALLLDAEGHAIANYRQTHRPTVPDEAVLGHGHWLTIMPFGAHRLGLLIGYDLEFPEPARALALAGCDLIAVPGGVTGVRPEVAAAVVAARAFENGCWVAYADAGPLGRIVGPDGRAAAGGAGPRLLLADVASPSRSPAGGRFAARRPRLYAELARIEEELPARPI